MQIQRAGGLGFAHVQNRTAATLGKKNKTLNKILERLATARRINRASDDAAGLSISEQLRTQIRGFKAASNNVSDAMSALNIADGATNKVAELLQRQRELALQSLNGTISNEQRAHIDQEYQQLQQEIDRSANATEFNRQDVGGGEGLASGDAQIQVGPNVNEMIELPPLNLGVDPLGLNGASVTDLSNARNALGRIDIALDQLNTQRSSIGATVNRFDSTLNNLSVAEANTQAAESALRDQDMAEGLTQLTRERLLSEGGIRAFARFNEISASHVLSLLQ
jgi:flagellin